jgi:hypothetical protein
MAIDLTQLLDTGSGALRINEITNDAQASATASVYCAWIQSITGTQPTVTEGKPGKVVLVLSPAQRSAMSKWLDAQVQGIINDRSTPTVDMGLGPVLGPWGLKYAAPTIIGAILAGWVAHYYLGGK